MADGVLEEAERRKKSVAPAGHEEEEQKRIAAKGRKQILFPRNT